MIVIEVVLVFNACWQLEMIPVIQLLCSFGRIMVGIGREDIFWFEQGTEVVCV